MRRSARRSIECSRRPRRPMPARRQSSAIDAATSSRSSCATGARAASDCAAARRSSSASRPTAGGLRGEPGLARLGGRARPQARRPQADGARPRCARQAQDQHDRPRHGDAAADTHHRPDLGTDRLVTQNIVDRVHRAPSLVRAASPPLCRLCAHQSPEITFTEVSGARRSDRALEVRLRVGSDLAARAPSLYMNSVYGRKTEVLRTDRLRRGASARDDPTVRAAQQRLEASTMRWPSRGEHALVALGGAEPPSGSEHI